MALLAGMGKKPGLSMYITNFGLSGATAEVSLSALALIICVLVNIINELAVEGMFRGFILKVVTERSGFKLEITFRLFFLESGILLCAYWAFMTGRCL